MIKTTPERIAGKEDRKGSLDRVAVDLLKLFLL